MSNILIDNPQRLAALSEQMQGFKNAFERFIENMRNAVKTTMDQLTRLRITMQKKIEIVENELNSLYDERGNYSWPEDKDIIWDIDAQIKDAKSLKLKYIEHKKKIDSAYKAIDYQYKQQVKHYEEKISESLGFYPRAIQGLHTMETLMKKYLTYSSDVVKTSLDGNYGGFRSNDKSEAEKYFNDYYEHTNKSNSTYIDKISYGRLINSGNLTDQILANAELEAQNKKAKFIQFEIGNTDEELCKRAGYEIHIKNGKEYAVKDLFNEIDLEGGLFKGGALYKSSEEYEID